jgi:hypothetical protein
VVIKSFIYLEQFRIQEIFEHFIIQTLSSELLKQKEKLNSSNK